ncbi:MAG: hypothetical protein HZC02_04880 [Candidatus Levybacteria bacterium]|nr:hypothetical protein [Candidatus Levybacteria bacterium]
MKEKPPIKPIHIDAAVASMLRNEGRFDEAQKLHALPLKTIHLYYPQSLPRGVSGNFYRQSNSS